MFAVNLRQAPALDSAPGHELLRVQGALSYLIAQHAGGGVPVSRLEIERPALEPLVGAQNLAGKLEPFIGGGRKVKEGVDLTAHAALLLAPLYQVSVCERV